MWGLSWQKSGYWGEGVGAEKYCYPMGVGHSDMEGCLEAVVWS